jgi:putative peptide zinc metalloprotease protein
MSVNQSVGARTEEDIAKVQTDSPAPDKWSLSKERISPAKYRPLRIDEAELADISGRGGAKRFMLRNPGNDIYLSLGEEELFLWNLMDGRHTVRDLALEYVSQYAVPRPETLLNLLELLTSNGFLKGEPPQAMHPMVVQSQKRRMLASLHRLTHYLIHGTLATTHIDKYFDWLYRHAARPLYTPPALIVIICLILADIAFFIYFFLIQHVDLLISTRGVHIVDIVSLMLIVYGGLVIHEVAHGLTVKAYGRRVLRGGVMLYFGVPLAFVDTTDIWMKPRRARIAVSLAGPCANAFIGGLLFLIAAFLSEGTVREILLHGGILNSIIFFVNLLPIAETDGHYVIQDYLEIPHLRSKALHFISHDMWLKSARRKPWARDEFTFLIYGLVTAAGTGFLVYVAIHFWITTGRKVLDEVIQRPHLVLEIFGVLVVIAGISALLYGLLARRRHITAEHIVGPQRKERSDITRWK